MNWVPAGLGAEPKKLAVLGGLVVVLGIVYWMNSGPNIPEGAVTTPPPAAASSSSATAPATKAPPTARRTTQASPRVSARSSNSDFEPSLRIPDDVDMTQVDPTLKLDLLARVRSVGDVGGRRSLFEFYAPPPPPPPEVKPIKPVEVPEPEPVKAPEAPKAAAAKPPPPPIPLKFYGYSGTPRDARRRAFFLEGEDVIHLVAENEIINGRYRIVRIGVNSAEVEDLENANTQTLPIVEVIPL